MDPNNPNPYQQPGTPQPQVPPQAQVMAGQQPSGAQPPVQPAQPIYSQPQPAYGQTPMPTRSGPKGKMIAIVAGIVVLIVIVVLAIVLLGHKNNSTGGTTASTGGSSASGGSATKKACQLYTLSEAQSLLGSSAQAVSLPTPASQFPGATSNTACEYTNSSENSVVIGVINFDNSSDASGGFSKAVANFTKLSNGSTSQVSGYGDQATYVSDGVIVVQKGTTVFDVFYVGSSPQSPDEQVANAILGNL